MTYIYVPGFLANAKFNAIIFIVMSELNTATFVAADWLDHFLQFG